MNQTLPYSITKLARFSWAQAEMSAYTLPGEGNGGLGVIAHRDPAAFNVAWALCGQEALIGGSREAHLHAVHVFALQEGSNQQIIQGARLGDWLTLYDPQEFGTFLRQEINNIDRVTRVRLVAAMVMLGVT